MYLFKKENRKNVLKGRTIRYLVNSKSVSCSEVHLSNVLNGKIPCSYLLAKNISECAGENVENLFVNLEK